MCVCVLLFFYGEGVVLVGSFCLCLWVVVCLFCLFLCVCVVVFLLMFFEFSLTV